MKNNIVKIGANPNIKPSVRIEMSSPTRDAGGNLVYIMKDGIKKLKRESYRPDNLSRAPGASVEYTATLRKDGTLATGLDIIVDNPYDDEIFYPDMFFEKVLKGKKKAKLQHVLEYKHSVRFDYYTNRVSKMQSFSSEKVRRDEVPFFQKPEARISLKDGLMTLDLSNPIKEVNYYTLKAHKKIANSLTELMEVNPFATHYIINEQEVSKIKSEKVRHKNIIGAAMQDLDSHNDESIFDMVKALEISSGLKNRDTAYEVLDKYANASDKNYEEFIKMYNMWKEPIHREKFLAYAELYLYLSTPGLIVNRGNTYHWSQPTEYAGKTEDFTWYSKQQVVDEFLTSPVYQDSVTVLRELYRTKKI